MNRFALHRQPTRYEIAATHEDGRSLLIAYAGGSPSRSNLLHAMQNRGNEVIAALSIGDADVMTFGTKPRPWAKVAGWTVTYTGRTQRECCGSERVYVADVVTA